MIDSVCLIGVNLKSKGSLNQLIPENPLITINLIGKAKNYSHFHFLNKRHIYCFYSVDRPVSDIAKASNNKEELALLKLLPMLKITKKSDCFYSHVTQSGSSKTTV